MRNDCQRLLVLMCLFPLSYPFLFQLNSSTRLCLIGKFIGASDAKEVNRTESEKYVTQTGSKLLRAKL